MAQYYCNKLSDWNVRDAKVKDKKYKLPDGKGLYCEVLATSTKVWRYNYRLNGKQKTYTIGQYPEISLTQARTLRDQAKINVQKGIDPSQKKQIDKKMLKESSFQAIAQIWLKRRKPHWSESNYKRTDRYLKKDVYPWLGQRDISTITAPEIIVVVEKVVERGAVDAAKRVKGFIQQVFDYAVAHGKASRNSAKDINLQMILPKRIKTHFAAITEPQQLAGLLRASEKYHGSITVKCALKLLLLVMLRPTELSAGEWSEINFDKKMWIVPAKRRKLEQHLKRANLARDAHTVPLSKQAIEILTELHHYTGKSKYIFPSPRGNSRPISNNTIRAALRTMGFGNEVITTHGFRGTASTFLNTLGYRHDVIEAQLGHKDKNAIRSAYNHADYLEERKVMLQEWADYLDGLRIGATVTSMQVINK